MGLNTKGVLTLDDETFEGKIVSHHGRLRVFAVKDTIFDEPMTARPDRLGKTKWSFTLDDGRQGQIQGQGCGCGGGR